MWIIPNNHPLSSAFVQEYSGSKEDWKELSVNLQLPLMRKSKPLSVRTLLRAWRRVFWIPPLFGRILKPSQQTSFEEKLTASLADIHASHSVPQENNEEKQIHDTCSLLYGRILKKYSQTGAFSKMSGVILNWDTPKFTEAFGIWATQLSAEYTARRKQAQLIRERGSLSLPLNLKNWPTATTSDTGQEPATLFARAARMKLRHGNRTGNGCGMSLGTAVKMWRTPMARDHNGIPGETFARGQSLPSMVKNWPTSRASDYKGCGPKGCPTQQYQFEKSYLEATVLEYSTDGQLDPENNNTTGRNLEQLNPAWVAQLMGTTLKRTFYVPSAIAW